MTYENLLANGRAMDAQELNDALRALVNDSRFAAVVGCIDQIKEQTADACCGENYSGSHGTLEHAAGVRRGLMMLEAKIRSAANPKKRTGERGPTE